MGIKGMKKNWVYLNVCRKYVLFFRNGSIMKLIPTMNGRRKNLANLSKDRTTRRTKKIRKKTNMTSTMSLWFLTG